MKLKSLKKVVVLASIFGLLAIGSAFAKDSSRVGAAKKALVGVSALELPAKAAGLVSQVTDKEKKSTTIAVVHAAVELNPSAVPAIIGAIARENPSVAAIAAVTAASLQPKQSALIVKAAAAGAPAQADKIVSAMIKEFPKQYAVWAIAASQGAPGAGQKILAVVAEYVPALQASIQKTLSTLPSTEQAVPVEAILNQSTVQAQQVQTQPFISPPAPSVTPVQGPPYTPPVATPVQISTTSPETNPTRYSSP